MLLALALASAVAGCGQPAATPDPSRGLHLQNDVSQAVIVSVSDRGSDASVNTAVRPCGGTLDLVLGREIPYGDDWLIGLAIDPSGSFDSALETWGGDPADMPGDFNVSIIWSRGDIHNADLPAALVIGSAGVAFPLPAVGMPSTPPSCAPWPASN